MTLKADRFGEFFEAAYGYGPFPWQERLAKRVFSGKWPRAIALPTAAGKTGCIDIAVFSLACGAKNAARRIFFVVDRRIVVDQAFEHAKALAGKLQSADAGILLEVADALREIAHPHWKKLKNDERKDVRPLDFYALRGGMYRETAWTRSPIQPTVITSTVDQVGSRLLFRGYGVSDSMRPVHAGLVGNDSIILLDEAHCARPFGQTVEAVEKYRQWGDGERRPFHFVSITATPANIISEKQIIRDNGEDRRHKVLGARIRASKPAQLVVAEKAKGKNGQSEMVKVLEQHARELGDEFDCVGIIVNRVATARGLRESLQKDFGDEVVLLTGRMRPLDRDELYVDKLKPLLSNSDGEKRPPRYVIGTQCLECGADFDFHALVTECASLDSLRQRFGRLNRVARRPKAKAVVVIGADQTEETLDDPVYGKSLAKTWKWLNGKAKEGVFDFGLAAVVSVMEGEETSTLNAPTSDAPVLFPAHLDCWVQTHPIPSPDPEPAIFLHGPDKPGQPDVQVVLRDDLGNDPLRWLEIVALCPPSSSEAVSVPIGTFASWLEGRSFKDNSGDVEGEPRDEDEGSSESTPRTALRWRGPARSSLVQYVSFNDTRRDVYVIPCSPDATKLGDFRTPVPADYAEQAFQKSRDKAFLRLLDSRVIADADDFEEAITAEIQSKLTETSPQWLRFAVAELQQPKLRVVEPHPRGGWVVTGKWRLRKYDPTYLEDSETDESFRGREISLVDHSVGVTRHAELFAAACGLPTATYRIAGMFHDAGKLDPRFQAMLRRCSPRTVAGNALAKSARSPRTKEERDQAREVHHYPSGARHELLSSAIVASFTSDDLLQYLVATHHGSARPFASAVDDSEASCATAPFERELFSMTFRLDSYAQQINVWNASLSERFWRVVRKLGWWESAYWETVFRLADHAQSRLEQNAHEPVDKENENLKLSELCATAIASSRHELLLSGLDGANPLSYLVSLGVVAELSAAVPGGVWLSWSVMGGTWRPSIWSGGELSAEQVAVMIAKQLGIGQADGNGTGTAEQALVAADKDHMAARKKHKDALEDIKKRKLRGKDRDKAMADEVEPLAAVVAEKRQEWLSLLKATSPSPELALGKDPAALQEHFRLIAEEIARDVEKVNRSCADLMTAFGCDAIVDAKSSKVRTTAFCFVTGSGHQYFLQNVRELLEQVDQARIQQALFNPQPHADAKLSMRWDPIEDRRYAVMWSDPTSSGNEAKTNWALNLLAYRGLQLLPSVPTKGGLATTGFAVHDDSRNWTWPIWTQQLSADSVRSLLSHTSLCDSQIDRAIVSSLGIAEVFRASRIQVGNPPLHKLNFTPSKSA